MLSIENSQLNKLFSLTAFISIILMLYCIISSPLPNRYELSIFSDYPYYFLLLPVISALMGDAILINEILNQSKTKWWVVGVIILIFSNALILLLPYFRNYTFYGRSDVITHYGYILDIHSGYIGSNNFYPLQHLLVIIGSLLTNINDKIIFICTPVIYFTIYFLGLYLFSSLLSKKQEITLLTTAFGSVFLYSYYNVMFIPNFLSFAFVPLILYFFFKSKDFSENRMQFSILLILFLLILPLSHVITSINMIFILIILGVSALITEKLNKISLWNKKQDNNLFKDIKINYKTVIVPAIILFIVFFMWFSYFAIFKGVLLQILNWVLHEVGTSPIADYQSRWTLSNMNLLNFIWMFIENYGHILIYIILSGISVIFILKNFFKSKINLFEIFIPLTFLSICMASFISLIGALGFSNPQREFIYAMPFAIILSAFIFSHWIDKAKSKKIIIIGVLLTILVISTSLGFHSSYSSVLAGNTNLQVTTSEINGAQWYLEHKDEYLKTYSINSEFTRYIELLKGAEYGSVDKWGYNSIPPKNFNFNSSSKGYLVLSEYIIQRFTIYWPDNPYFSKSSFKELNEKQNINRIYDDSGMQIWKLTG